ncbi:sigma 54-interacting transcriptional regulator [Thermodesulfobacteriota bacterium]
MGFGAISMPDMHKNRQELLNELLNLRKKLARATDERRRTESDLNRAREEAAQEAHKLRSMIEGMEEGVVIADVNDVITEVNGWFLNCFHISRPQVLGKSIWELHPDSAAVQSVRRLVNDCRNLVKQDTIILNRKLWERHVTLRVQPVIESGQYKGVVLNVIDVTDLKETQERLQKAYDQLEERVGERTAELSAMNERLLDEFSQRRRAEEELRESEARYRLLTDNSLTGIFMHQEERFIYVNSRFANMLGYRIDELVGMEFWRVYRSEDQEEVRLKALARYRGEEIPPYSEVRIVTKHGETRWVEVLATTAEHDGRTAIMGSLADITERKLAEAALAESEQKFRALFENAQDCIFMKDLDRRYTDVNPAMAELFEMTVSDLVGKTDDVLFGRPAAQHLEEVDTRVLRGESIEEEHTRIVNGRPITFLDVRIPMRSNKGEIVGLYGIARNITDRTRGRSAMTEAAASEYPAPAMRSLLRTARTAARKRGNILILGESGSGKDYLARYLHDHSTRADSSFYALNCAAVPSELAESELFGHESGAFTGAKGRKRGLVELAEGGTLLLNEIGELPLQLQAKLLAFFDTKSFTRVGGERPISVDARILAATNRDLQAEMQAGRFRRDLYYRLHVLRLSVPPLRERIDDIPILVGEIMESLASEMQLSERPVVDQATVDRLMAYNWPGNVRELRNVLERALMLWEGGPLKVGPLGEAVSGEEWSYVVRFPRARSMAEVTRCMKESLVREALRRNEGNRTRAARLLGVTRFSLLRVLKGGEDSAR